MPQPRSRIRPAVTSGSAVALLLLALLLLLLTAARAVAQTRTLQPGDSVRVSRADVVERYSLVRIEPGTLVVRRADGGEIEIPAAGPDRIDVLARRTRAGEVARHTLAGGIIGTAAGALFGLIVPPERNCSFMCFSRMDHAMMGGMILGATGTGVGMAIGLMKPTGRYWRPIDPERLAVEVGPAGDGLRLGIRVRPRPPLRRRAGPR